MSKLATGKLNVKARRMPQKQEIIDMGILLSMSEPTVSYLHYRLPALSCAPSSSSDARNSYAFNPPSVLDDPILLSFSGGYIDDDRVRGVPPPTPSDWKVNSGYGEGWAEALSGVQIRNAPSWLPVANMKESAAEFQATHVKSPPTICARTWCNSAPDSRSQI